jgi:1,4-alpha-glucan branching enzyme
VPTRDRRAELPDAIAPRTPDRIPASKARVEVIAVGAGKYTVRVHAPDARRVEIMGDFTNWTVEDATPVTNGWWTVVMRITPGVHQFNVRLDGGEWTVPAGVTAERDEFGAATGVMIVR